MTSLPPAELNAAQWSECNRAAWGIKSGLHQRSRQNKPRHQTITDFFTAMNAEHHRYALPCLQARQSSFRSSS